MTAAILLLHASTEHGLFSAWTLIPLGTISAIYYIFAGLNAVARRRITERISHALNARVTVAEFSARTFRGPITMRDVRIEGGNALSSGAAFEAATVRMDVAPRNLRSESVVIPLLEIEEAGIFLDESAERMVEVTADGAATDPNLNSAATRQDAVVSFEAFTGNEGRQTDGHPQEDPETGSTVMTANVTRAEVTSDFPRIPERPPASAGEHPEPYTGRPTTIEIGAIHIDGHSISKLRRANGFSGPTDDVIREVFHRILRAVPEDRPGA